MAKCYACKNYQSGYCKLTGTHSYTGDICNEFVNKEQSKMFDDSKSELRATKHALWMARATIIKGCWRYQFNFLKDKPMDEENIPKWQWAERKCREYAERFK